MFRKDKGDFTDDSVHESVSAPDPKPILDGWLLHEGDQEISSYLIRLDRYTTLAAQEKLDEGVRVGLAEAVLRSHAAFWRMWVLQAGFRDGWPGLVLCLSSGFYVLSKYVKLWRMGDR